MGKDNTFKGTIPAMHPVFIRISLLFSLFCWRLAQLTCLLHSTLICTTIYAYVLKKYCATVCIRLGSEVYFCQCQMLMNKHLAKKIDMQRKKLIDANKKVRYIAKNLNDQKFVWDMLLSSFNCFKKECICCEFYWSYNTLHMCFYYGIKVYKKIFDLYYRF